MKIRTVNWYNSKISEVLSKNPTIDTGYELAALVLCENSTIEEHHNYDIALTLISRNIIKRLKDNKAA